MREILSCIKHADFDFELIENGDKIAIGLSGGKDSTLLLLAMQKYQKYGKKNFEIIAITIDPTNGKHDYSQEKKLCENLSINLHIETTNIFEVVFDIRKESNPCSLCAKMRRGTLCNVAKKLGCNKIALGHHSDDAEETFFLSLLYEGRINTFSAKSYLSNTDITLIRPLIYCHENQIINSTKNMNFTPAICDVDLNTKRQEIKELIKEIKTKFKPAEINLSKSIKNLLKK